MLVNSRVLAAKLIGHTFIKNKNPSIKLELYGATRPPDFLRIPRHNPCREYCICLTANTSATPVVQFINFATVAPHELQQPTNGPDLLVVKMILRIMLSSASFSQWSRFCSHFATWHVHALALLLERTHRHCSANTQMTLHYVFCSNYCASDGIRQPFKVSTLSQSLPSVVNVLPAGGMEESVCLCETA
jgi:hypothetical protein